MVVLVDERQLDVGRAQSVDRVKPTEARANDYDPGAVSVAHARTVSRWVVSASTRAPG
jgi:hypothetical protein